MEKVVKLGVPYESCDAKTPEDCTNPDHEWHAVTRSTRRGTEVVEFIERP